VAQVRRVQREHDVVAENLKLCIKIKMEQIDSLKMSLLKYEYELYNLYSKLSDLEAS